VGEEEVPVLGEAIHGVDAGTIGIEEVWAVVVPGPARHHVIATNGTALLVAVYEIHTFRELVPHSNEGGVDSAMEEDGDRLPFARLLDHHRQAPVSIEVVPRATVPTHHLGTVEQGIDLEPHPHSENPKSAGDLPAGCRDVVIAPAPIHGHVLDLFRWIAAHPSRNVVGTRLPRAGARVAAVVVVVAEAHLSSENNDTADRALYHRHGFLATHDQLRAVHLAGLDVTVEILRPAGTGAARGRGLLAGVESPRTEEAVATHSRMSVVREHKSEAVTTAMALQALGTEGVPLHSHTILCQVDRLMELLATELNPPTMVPRHRPRN